MIPVVDKFGLPRHSHSTKKVVGQYRKLKGFCYFLNVNMHMTWLFVRNNIYMNILMLMMMNKSTFVHIYGLIISYKDNNV